MHLALSSIRLSVHCVLALNSEMESRRKTKIAVNVPIAGSSHYASIQLSQVTRTAAQYVGTGRHSFLLSELCLTVTK